MYTRILVPLDGSALAEQVLPYAEILALGLRSQVDLLQVVQAPMNEVALATHPTYYQGIKEAELHKAQGYLEGITNSLREKELSASYSVLEGNPASCIATESERESGTLIAMASHGRSGLSRWLLGSVANQVLETTTNPLLIVRSAEDGSRSKPSKLAHVVVPLDGSELAEEVLPYVGRLSRALGLGVNLVRATPTRESYYRYADHPLENWDNMITEVDGQAAEYLHQIGRKLLSQGVTSVEERLLHGSPAEAIINLAQEIPDSMVMMTTHGRTGMGRWVLGSVADRVVRHSGDPVLLVRVPAVGEGS